MIDLSSLDLATLKRRVKTAHEELKRKQSELDRLAKAIETIEETGGVIESLCLDGSLSISIAESDQKSEASDMEESISAAIPRQSDTAQPKRRKTLKDAVREYAEANPGQSLSIATLHVVLKEKGMLPKGKQKRSIISGALRRLKDEGVLELVEKGTGNTPWIYRLRDNLESAKGSEERPPMRRTK